ncbi:tryptophan synthase subunit alpha [Aureivirga sp. CE67]|uniref:tryptophan synthase subunit alpha n=1 Tax=Aureivirga sp. CE67 TaxID=1788983 RepID=UPI0018C977BE|nr:tryptophan synthase subunit alpha [Aureivirga sp. CE67]
MNKLNKIFKEKKNRISSLFFTAGFPTLDSTIPILKTLEKNKIDFVEVGMPYSDPMADGETIQNSSKIALENGMNLDILFSQLEKAKNEVSIPMVLMGYLNQVLKYGVDKFCERCKTCGIETVILPDLPIFEYEKFYKEKFEKYGIQNVFLITPQTSEERIRKIDALSETFIYVVASASITGAKSSISEKQISYFERIQKMNLKNPTMIGFGISNKETFDVACEYANGAIIGSAFIKMISNSENYMEEFQDWNFTK